MGAARILVVSVTWLWAGGCGVVAVGGPCEVRDDCVPGLSCVESPPGGFCTRGCTEEGVTTECPGGTICIFMGQGTLACSPLCTSSQQCRLNYECAPAGGTTARMACRPEGTRR